MEIIFLGTSSGTPTKTRNVSGLAIRKSNAKAWCMVDCGEGSQHRILEKNLTLKNLQSIFITHIHGDHCYGLPGVLASAAMAGRTEPLWLYGPKKIQSFVEGMIESTELWLGYDIYFVDVEAPIESTPILDFEIEVIELSHRVPSFAYAFTEKNRVQKLNVKKLKEDQIPSGPSWGQLQKGMDITLENGCLVHAKDYLLASDEPRKIIIGGDNDRPDLLTDAARNAHVLVHEATYTQEVLEKIGEGPQHSSAKRVAEFSEKNQLANLVLTHFSPRYADKKCSGQSIDDIENEAKEYFSGNLILANDLDCYELKKDGLFIRKSDLRD